MNSPVEHEPACTLETTAGRCELDANLEILRHVDIFAGIPLQRLKLYAYLSRRICYRSGDFLFRQGEADDRGYIVLSGKAQVIREYHDHSVLLNELREGDFFGGLALLANIKRLFSVKAVTDLECLTLDRESFQKILVQYPEIAVKVLDIMIKRIVQMEEKLLQKHVEQCVYG